MKIVINALIVIAAGMLGLAVGFAFRGRFSSVPTGPSALAQPKTTNSQTGSFYTLKSHAASRFNDDSPLVTKLAHDLAMSSGVTRWLYWFDALEKALPGDYPRLFQLAQGDAAALGLVSDRWIKLYPRSVFEAVAAALKAGWGASMRDLAYQLFRVWPKRDPDAVIAALNESGDVGLRNIWRSTVAAQIIEKDPERGLQLFRDWHLENFGPRMDGIAKWAAADPRHAAEFTLANPTGYASQLAMESIGREWAKTDPRSALEFAASKPGELVSILSQAALKEWAGRNIKQAADWLAAADGQTRNHLSAAFVEAWAKQDAASALTWCESNLSGSSLSQAVAGALKGAAEKNVGGAAELVAAMNPSAARAEAAVAVARKWFPGLSAGNAAKPEAIAWLAGLDSDSTQRVVQEVEWGWATSDPKSMAAFLSSNSERYAANAYSLVAREIARKNPLDALDWASRLPEDRSLSAGGDAYAEWRSSQPDAAIKWLNELPPGDARRQPYFESAIRVLAWDPQFATQFTTLSETERATARSVIESIKNLPEDRRASLLELLKAR